MDVKINLHSINRNMKVMFTLVKRMLWSVDDDITDQGEEIVWNLISLIVNHAQLLPH